MFSIVMTIVFAFGFFIVLKCSDLWAILCTTAFEYLRSRECGVAESFEASWSPSDENMKFIRQYYNKALDGTVLAALSSIDHVQMISQLHLASWHH